MASSFLSKLSRPSLLTQLVSCERVNLSPTWLRFVIPNYRVLVQVSLRLTTGLPGKLLMWNRLCSSDSPAENISRYPVPSKRDLPSDIVELMEEVESKVQSNDIHVLCIAALSTVVQWVCKTRRFLTGRLFAECLQSPLPQTGRVQSLLLLLWCPHEQRDRSVFACHQWSYHHVFTSKLAKLRLITGQVIQILIPSRCKLDPANYLPASGIH